MKTRKTACLPVLIVGCVALVLLGFAADRFLRPYDLEHEREVARAAGVPIFPSDLELPSYPPDQNAAGDYLALADLLKEKPLVPSAHQPVMDNIPRSGRLTDVQTDIMRRLLASRRDVTGLIHQAVVKDGALGEQDWSPDARFPVFAPAREAAKILRWESWVMARNGRFVDAVRNQALGFRLSRQISDYPTLIGFLACSAIESITLNGMEDILVEAGPDPQVADTVREEVARIQPPDFAFAMRGEALFGQETIRSIQTFRQAAGLGEQRQESEPVVEKPRKPGFLLKHYLLQAHEAVYLHWMTRHVEAARLPITEISGAMAKVQQEFERKASRSPSYLLTSIRLPVFAKASDRERERQAQRDVLSMGAAVMAYRGRNGVWPERLEQALPDAPMDVFGGKPLVYRREENGFVVISAGLIGGSSDTSGRKVNREIAFRYPRPEEPAPPKPVVSRPEESFLPPVMPPGFQGAPMPGPPPIPGGPPSNH